MKLENRILYISVYCTVIRFSNKKCDEKYNGLLNRKVIKAGV